VPEKLYTIEEVTRRTELTPAGRFEVVYDVSFTTKSGVRDTVVIPEAEYNRETVKRLVEEKAREHEEVMKLG